MFAGGLPGTLVASSFMVKVVVSLAEALVVMMATLAQLIRSAAEQSACPKDQTAVAMELHFALMAFHAEKTRSSAQVK